MLAFLERVPSLPYPTVTLTPGGESCASWESDGDFAFNTLFHASERVQFYIIYPNADDITVSDELSGSTTSSSLPDLAAYVRLSEWAEK
jgi:hypothetical protein